jgi:acyl-CoA synthetase (AMP-forming)/AMP-acid ligase II
MIVKHPQVDAFDLSSVRSITLGSAPPSLFTMQEFKRRWDIDIGNIWGQNEGTGIVSGPKDVPDMEVRVDHLPQFGARGAAWSSKLVIEGVQTKLVAPDTGQEVTEVGQVGELAYKGPNVIPGYFKRPDLTDKAFDSGGYFYTGDLFVIKDNHFIGFFERKKDIIVRGGFNISAQEVENAILGHPKVMEAAVVGQPDEILGERTCVFVVPRQGEEITLEDVISFLEEQGLAKYKYPESLHLVESLPRNPVGKLLKNDLRRRLRNEAGRA